MDVLPLQQKTTRMNIYIQLLIINKLTSTYNILWNVHTIYKMQKISKVQKNFASETYFWLGPICLHALIKIMNLHKNLYFSNKYKVHMIVEYIVNISFPFTKFQGAINITLVIILLQVKIFLKFQLHLYFFKQHAIPFFIYNRIACT